MKHKKYFIQYYPLYIGIEILINGNHLGQIYHTKERNFYLYINQKYINTFSDLQSKVYTRSLDDTLEKIENDVNNYWQKCYNWYIINNERRWINHMTDKQIKGYVKKFLSMKGFEVGVVSKNTGLSYSVVRWQFEDPERIETAKPKTVLALYNYFKSLGISQNAKAVQSYTSFKELA